MAILIIWLIPSDAKTPILLSSRTNKEKTVVKLGNTSNTYNRSSSTSSMNITAATGLLSPEADNHSTHHDTLSNSQELEPFLLNEMQTKSLLQSSTSSQMMTAMGANSNASNNILMPSSLMSNTSSQANLDGTSIHTGSNNFLLNNSNYINEGINKQTLKSCLLYIFILETFYFNYNIYKAPRLHRRTATMPR
jgi:hypothetical protein